MEYWLGIFHEDNAQLKDIARAAERMGYTGIGLPATIETHKWYEIVLC